MSNVVKSTSRLTTPSPAPEKPVTFGVLDFAEEEAGKPNQTLEEVFALPLLTRHCPACGNDSASADVVCISCGEYMEIEETLPGNVVYCAECGAPATPEDIFCLSCGAVLD